jgi:hypothetical protein
MGDIRINETEKSRSLFGKIVNTTLMLIANIPLILSVLSLILSVFTLIVENLVPGLIMEDLGLPGLIYLAPGGLVFYILSMVAIIPLLMISVVSRIIMLCIYSKARNWKQIIILIITIFIIILIFYLCVKDGPQRLPV